jgi:cytoskeletal protein CcmA (bactofilin family)
MFNKRAENNSNVPVVSSSTDNGARMSQKVASLIGDDMVIEGNINGQGEIHLNGIVRGDITVERLSIGETGLVEGTVTADTVDVRGKLVGSLCAKQVKLYGTAHVDGDITHEQLSMDPGAYFQGRSLKFQRQISVSVSGSVPSSQDLENYPAD